MNFFSFFFLCIFIIVHSIPFNHIQSKGTHNSYHVKPNPSFGPWYYTHPELSVQLEEQGVRHFELDFFWNPNSSFVAHILKYDEETNCAIPTIPGCLSPVKIWSDANPTHSPLVFFLEPKSSVSSIDWDALDAELLSVFPMNSIITPSELSDVVENGWPSIDSLRGKVIFVFLTPGLEDIYTGNITFPIFEFSNRGDPRAVFLKMDSPFVSGDIQTAVSEGYMVRTRADDTFVPDEFISTFFNDLFDVIDFNSDGFVTFDETMDFFEAFEIDISQFGSQSKLSTIFAFIVTQCGATTAPFDRFQKSLTPCVVGEIEKTAGVNFLTSFVSLANTTTRANLAKSSGAQFISTDYPFGSCPYSFRLNEGSGQQYALRCNPVNSLPNCSSQALENLPYNYPNTQCDSTPAEAIGLFPSLILSFWLFFSFFFI